MVRVDAAAYDPATDSWRRLPTGPLGKRESFSSVWTGKELIVVGGNLGDTLAQPVAAALDPEAGTWRLLPALNRITGLMPSPGVAWDGREVFVMGSVCAQYHTSCSPTLLAYDPATDALRKIDLTKAPIAPPQLKLIGVNGSDLVFATEALAMIRIFVVRYDPTTDSWGKGALAPFPVPIGAYTQRAWLKDRLVAGRRIEWSADLQPRHRHMADDHPGSVAAQLPGGQRDRVDGTRPDRVERHRVRELQPHPRGRRLTNPARLTAAHRGTIRAIAMRRRDDATRRRGTTPSCGRVCTNVA